jgi:hypothetical protein
MLTISAQALQNIEFKFLENSLIESSAIHSRALVKFFFDSENDRFPNDALAENFFATTESWRSIYPKKPKELDYDEFGKFADKQVAHIVYSEMEKHIWNFVAISDILQPIFDKFMSTISKDQVGTRWIDYIGAQEGQRWEHLKTIINEKFSE